MVKKTTEQFKEEIYQLVKDEYQVLGEYEGSKQKIKMVHSKCGSEYMVTPSEILRGTRCPDCRKNKKKTHEEFAKQVYDLVGDEFKVVGQYINSKTPIKMYHSRCGELINIIPNDFTSGGSRCRICSDNKNKQKTTEEYKLEVEELTSGEFQLVGEYTKSYEPVKIKHLPCKFINEITPNDFKTKQNCPICHRCGEYTREIYQAKFDKIYGDEYKLLSDMNDIKGKVSFQHLKCHSIQSVKARYLIDNKYECKKCKNEIIKQEDYNRFIDSLYSNFKNDIKLIGEYININKKTEFIFTNCDHVISRTPKQILETTSCPTCIKHNEFVLKVRDISDNTYKVLSEFTKVHDIIEFKHKVCGCKFSMRANNFISGQRCPDCSDREKALSQEEFIERVNVQGEGEYTVVSDYVNTKTKVFLKHLNCGSTYPVRPEKFYEGSRCPICNESKGEQSIRHWLTNNNFNFTAQKEYDGLIGTGGGLLRYDFYLPNHNLLIEFQGEQHERYVKGLHPSILDFKNQKEHDKRKRDYAVQHNIELLEIWYWDFENIDEILNNKLLNGAY